MSTSESKPEGLKIGNLAEVTGISVHTLRMWERRYGVPKPVRLASGHRRYPREEVPRLCAVARALEAGYRANRVVTATLDELKSLLHEPRPSLGNSASESAGKLEEAEVSKNLIEGWIESSLLFESQPLTNSFYEEWGRRGPHAFVETLAIPFIHEIGIRWQAGEMTVSQEHFASQHLSDFLGTSWRNLNERNQGAPILFTTLPGDDHCLGLQLGAVMAASARRRVVFLGTNTPCEEIISAVLKSQSQALCVGVSVTMQSYQVLPHLNKIRQRLEDSFPIVLGGKGVPEDMPGFLYFENFQAFYDWCLGLK